MLKCRQNVMWIFGVRINLWRRILKVPSQSNQLQLGICLFPSPWCTMRDVLSKGHSKKCAWKDHSWRQSLSNSSWASNLYALGVCLHMMNDHQQALLTFTECRRQMKPVDNQEKLKLGHLHLWAPGQQFSRLEKHTKASQRLTSALTI